MGSLIGGPPARCRKVTPKEVGLSSQTVPPARARQVVSFADAGDVLDVAASPTNLFSGHKCAVFAKVDLAKA